MNRLAHALLLLAGTIACAQPRGGMPVGSEYGPNFMQFRLIRGDAQPGARVDVVLTEPSGTRTFTSTDPQSAFGEYRLGDAGSLRVSATVRDDSAYVRGDGLAVISLEPDLMLYILVTVLSPSRDPRFYGCPSCQHRLAFPLVGATVITDSLVIWWSSYRMSRPPPQF